ncbi:hypothetical protein F5X97DRAFT_293792 [Nemania serpens]|nr:hypothetical protein F5X97DRAFT_293792 [Nemania serpens]
MRVRRYIVVCVVYVHMHVTMFVRPASCMQLADRLTVVRREDPNQCSVGTQPCMSVLWFRGLCAGRLFTKLSGWLRAYTLIMGIGGERRLSNWDDAVSWATDIVVRDLGKSEMRDL